MAEVESQNGDDFDFFNNQDINEDVDEQSEKKSLEDDADAVDASTAESLSGDDADDPPSLEEDDEEEETPKLAPISIKRKRQTPVKRVQNGKTTMLVSSSTKKRRWRPGTVALRDIRRLQASTQLIIPRLHFYKLVKEILSDPNIVGNREEGLKIKRIAVDALREPCEHFAQEIFQLASDLMVHAKRVKLELSDVQLAKKLVLKEMNNFRVHG